MLFKTTTDLLENKKEQLRELCEIMIDTGPYINKLIKPNANVTEEQEAQLIGRLALLHAKLEALKG